MKIRKYFIVSIVAVTMTGCDSTTNLKQQELEEKKVALTEKNGGSKTIEKKQHSLKDAVKIAEAKFKKYLPTILAANNAYIDSQETFTGDFTGDGIADIAIYFSLAPNEGGNTIVGQGLTLYKNTGSSVKVIAGYEPSYLFNFQKISHGKIYVKKLAYAETDGRCCPSIETVHILTISGNKVY